MIKIFDAQEKEFSSNGNVVIDPLNCKEYKKKSLNGWYIECEIDIKYNQYIEKDKLCVLKTRSKANPQAFRIGEKIKRTNTKISFTAEHVMFDAKDYFLLDVRPTKVNGSGALEYINLRTDKKSPFIVYSNIEMVTTEYFIRKSLFEAWSLIEERWGGVFDADNWKISLLNHVGSDKGESVIYGKNMENMIIFEDWSGVCTKLYPVGYDELLLPEEYIESEVQYEKPYTRTITFESDLDVAETEEEELIKELRKKAIEYLNENKYPKISYEINSNINQNMEIGDIIQVKHPLTNIETEVLEYVNDVVLEKIISLTFGNYSRDVKVKFDSIKSSIAEVKNIVSKQEVTIEAQTSLIKTLNKNGYVYIDENEILILDKLPKEKAKNIWRFGLGGIGFSSEGYEGPFKTAITMDGKINADFITTGKLSVNIIEGLSEKLEQWSKIMLDMEGIKLLVHNTIDITKEKQENTNCLELNNCMRGKLQELEIFGDNDVFGDCELDQNTEIDQSSIFYKRNTTLKINARNLKDNIQYVTGNLDIVNHQYNTGLKKCKSIIIPIPGNRTYTVLKNSGNRFALGTFDKEPEPGIIATNYISDDNEGKGLTKLEIISSENDKYLVIFFYDGNLDSNLEEMYNSIKVYSGYKEIDLEFQGTLNSVIKKEILENGTIEETRICDSLLLKNDTLFLIRRVGFDSLGNLYYLEKENYINLMDIEINLEEGTNTIGIADFYCTEMRAKYVITNEYTKIFSTKVERNALIEMLENRMKFMVTQNNVLASVNLAIENDLGVIEFKGNTIIIDADNLKVDKYGYMEAFAGTIGGWNINPKSLTKGLAGINAVDETMSFQEVFYVGKGLGKDGNCAWSVNTMGDMRGNSLNLYALSSQDKYPAYIKIYNASGAVGTNIEPRSCRYV